MLDLIPQLEDAGVDAILDLGLSKKKHREKFRRFASAHQMELKLHFLDIPKEVRRERVLKRNQEKGETFAFEVSEENFLFMEDWFEAPTEEELENSVLIRE